MAPRMTLSQQGVIHGLGYSVVKALAALASLPRDFSMPLEERPRQASGYLRAFRVGDKI